MRTNYDILSLIVNGLQVICCTQGEGEVAQTNFLGYSVVMLAREMADKSLVMSIVVHICLQAGQ